MLVLCRIHEQFVERFHSECIDLLWCRKLCSLDLEFLGACRNDVVYQTLTTETDKGFHTA